jgi:hypothetical protein
MPLLDYFIIDAAIIDISLRHWLRFFQIIDYERHYAIAITPLRCHYYAIISLQIIAILRHLEGQQQD